MYLRVLFLKWITCIRLTVSRQECDYQCLTAEILRCKRSLTFDLALKVSSFPMHEVWIAILTSSSAFWSSYKWPWSCQPIVDAISVTTATCLGRALSLVSVFYHFLRDFIQKCRDLRESRLWAMNESEEENKAVYSLDSKVVPSMIWGSALVSVWPTLASHSGTHIITLQNFIFHSPP